MNENPDELNPEHPVTQTLHEQWHKIAALIMMKLGVKQVVITQADMDEFLKQEGSNIVLHAHADCMDIRIVGSEEAKRLVKLGAR